MDGVSNVSLYLVFIYMYTSIHNINKHEYKILITQHTSLILVRIKLFIRCVTRSLQLYVIH